LLDEEFLVSRNGGRSLQLEFLKSRYISAQNGDGVDFDQAVFIYQAADLNQGAGGQIPLKILRPDLMNFFETFHVGHIDGHFYDLVEGGFGLFENDFHVFKDLPGLGSHISFPDNIPIDVPCGQPGNKRNSFPSALTAWEKTPTGLLSFEDMIACFFILPPFLN